MGARSMCNVRLPFGGVDSVLVVFGDVMIGWDWLE